ncbi:preprotein translocase subunit SecG [Metallibacterium scheffleri]|uniref:Protein-export membrane protein SecG n=1 Tax=Metallibacterium scheffleri TaxID=993689 RepID=A0A4S3KJS6_9GAMM|nr:preprotein translocase subunit SecG [Metallibacterium scheffleri]THD09037.1 preprotein translocase subunit SecG [Metallibacterium scheffleri]
MFTIFSILYVLIAASMIVLILLQRGDGANAGAGFGGGASGTVFGARGSSSFLSRATAVLATLFFVVSLGMAIYLSRAGTPQATAQQGLGVMAGAAPSAAAKAQTRPAQIASPVVPTTKAPVAAPAAPAPKPEAAGGK